MIDVNLKISKILKINQDIKDQKDQSRYQSYTCHSIHIGYKAHGGAWRQNAGAPQRALGA
jgi:hypothetical protein